MKWRIALIGFLFLLLSAGGNQTPGAYENKLVIGLDTAATQLTRAQCKSGLLWTLSYLGATLPASASELALKWQSATQVVLYPDLIGLPSEGLKAFEAICDSLRKTTQYQRTGEVPAGAFVAVMVGCADHYYAITEAPKTLKAFKKQHRTKRVHYVVNHSAISSGTRHLLFGRAMESGFWSLALNKKAGRESVESIDVMPNGQLRFLIYDDQGRLSATPREKDNSAGKPAKCMWCHEGQLQRPYNTEMNAVGALVSAVDSKNIQLTAFRNALKSGFSFEPHGAHTYMEILYISYLEPTLLQLSREWQMKVEDVRFLLLINKRHLHPEFSFGDSLYTRSDVEHQAPYSIAVPRDVREWNETDPCFLIPIKRKD